MEDVIENGELVDKKAFKRYIFLWSIIGVAATSYTWRVMVVNKVNYDDKAALDEVAEKINHVNGD